MKTKTITDDDLHRAKTESILGGWVEKQIYRNLKINKKIQDFELKTKCKEVKTK